jgi:hypothetical protein
LIACLAMAVAFAALVKTGVYGSAPFAPVLHAIAALAIAAAVGALFGPDPLRRYFTLTNFLTPSSIATQLLPWFFLWSTVLAAILGIAELVVIGQAVDPDAHRRRLRVVAMFAIPLCVSAGWDVILRLLLFAGAAPRLTDLLWAPTIGAYYYFPSVFGIGFLVTAAAFVAYAISCGTFRMYRIRMVLYAVAVILYTVYTAWWHVTVGQLDSI